MVGRIRTLLLVVLCALAVAAPASADVHLTKAQKTTISALVNRFVTDVVLRRNLPDGWKIAGPQMRGGTTEREWNRGSVPVQRLNLIGHDWANSWYATCEGATGEAACGVPGEVGLTVNFRAGPRKDMTMYDEELVLDKIHGKLLVNGFYTNATFRLGKGHRGSCVSTKCAITGPHDFAAGAGGGNAAAPAPLGSDWLWLAIGGIAAVPLTALLFVVLNTRRKNRRAWEAYVNTKRA